MARFDVYANPFAAERSHTPYVLDMQNNHLEPMGTRVVIPLRTPKGFGKTVRDLNPPLQVEGKTVILDTAALAPVPTMLLKKPVSNLETQRDELLDALDILFGAY